MIQIIIFITFLFVPPRIDNGFTPLFNGTNLDGWYTIIDEKGSEKDLFVVENEMIHVYARQAHLSRQSFGAIVTDKSYRDYILRFEYKWGQKKFIPRQDFVRDAGIIFHMHGDDIIWPFGVECQIQEGDTGDLWAIGTQVTSKIQPTIRNYASDGELVTRGIPEQKFQRFHRSYCWEKEGWNQIEITVRGDHAVFKVNGKTVNEAIDIKYWDKEKLTWKPMIRGKILLQAEGAEIFYRNIEIKEL